MASGTILGRLRGHLVPQRALAASVALLALRLTAGIGLYEAGMGKVAKLRGECSSDPNSDCERDARENCADDTCRAGVGTVCARERKAACQEQADKTVAWFGDLTIAGRAGWKLPGGGKLNFTLAAVQEVGFGVLIGVGAMARLCAVPAVLVMAVAMLTAHWDSFNTKFDFTSELAFAYLVMLLAVAALGPGLFSIDALLARGADATRGGTKGKKPASA
ncbi:MAG: DoxX family protein [Myxococcales bacterium]|nr:DoxX family protein [Myxococcales bacterium]